MNPKPNILESVLPIFILFVSLGGGALLWGFSNPLLIVSLLLAAAAAGVVAFRHGKGWDDIQEETGAKLAAALPAIIILLAIGVLVGCWMFSGTIPLLVYYGIEFVNPRFIVLTAFLATAAMSLASGTSWGSAGTVGVALMATAAAVGAPLAVTAGAVISGAYFGDKMSPLSDSTNISAIGAGSDLYDHIGSMVYTALPSFVVALVVFLSVGISAAPSGSSGIPEKALQTQKEISALFALGLPALIPPLIALIGMFRKYPAALVIVVSSVAAMLVGVFANGFAFKDAVT
ncbi:MAG: Na+/H+ antiporter NhaC, partial [Pyrinomonadaceae bacterium]|nr:Na+/H+ antiporter NhaC [Pyrinomonadaceae bacterium]